MLSLAFDDEWLGLAKGHNEDLHEYRMSCAEGASSSADGEGRNAPNGRRPSKREAELLADGATGP